MAKRVLAFVLGGGGPRGALQVGSLRALFEAGIKPDLLVGTSIGACNAAYLALHGMSLAAVDELTGVWRDAAVTELLPSNTVWLTMRALFRPQIHSYAEARVRAFWLAHGLTPEQRFGQIEDVRLLVVASDLNSGQPVLYGNAAEDSIFDAILASSALPPWMSPVRRDGQLLIDGGFLSNLPIEAALNHGATEIIAFDLADDLPGDVASATGLRPGVVKLGWSVQRRVTELELRLAASAGVTVQRIALCVDPPVGIWDFTRTEELMAAGYEITCRALAGRRQVEPRTRFWTARDWLARSAGRMARRRRAA